MATGFIADAASMPFVVSNLVNIVTASYFGISFLEYSAVMLIPDVVSIAASLFFLWIFYRNSVMPSFGKLSAKDADIIRDPLIFKIATPFILCLVAVYALGGLLGIPVALIAVPAVAGLTIVAIFSGRLNVRAAIRGAPWQIVLFSLGMYIVVFGMGREGITTYLTDLIIGMQTLPGPLSIVASGFAFAAIAALMNNMPSVMIINLSIGQLSGNSVMIFTNVIANDIGPKFTTIGSLATLLWLHSLERKGVARISAWYYTKVGLLIGIPVLMLTLLSLWATMNLLF